MKVILHWDLLALGKRYPLSTGASCQTQDNLVKLVAISCWLCIDRELSKFQFWWEIYGKSPFNVLKGFQRERRGGIMVPLEHLKRRNVGRMDGITKRFHVTFSYLKCENCGFHFIAILHRSIPQRWCWKILNLLVNFNGVFPRWLIDLCVPSRNHRNWMHLK